MEVWADFCLEFEHLAQIWLVDRIVLQYLVLVGEKEQKTLNRI